MVGWLKGANSQDCGTKVSATVTATPAMSFHLSISHGCYLFQQQAQPVQEHEDARQQTTFMKSQIATFRGQIWLLLWFLKSFHKHSKATQPKPTVSVLTDYSLQSECLQQYMKF